MYSRGTSATVHSGQWLPPLLRAGYWGGCCWYFLASLLRSLAVCGGVLFAVGFFSGVFCVRGVFFGGIKGKGKGDRADSMQRAEATATVTGCMLWGILLAFALPLSLAALLGHGHGSLRLTVATPPVLVYAVVGWFLFSLSALATHP